MSAEIDQNKRKKVETMLEKELLYNKTIKMLLDSIQDSGCSLPTNFFRIKNCENNVSGGFALETDSKTNSYIPTITVCANNGSLEPETFTHTLIHELVHAYDVCKVKNFDANKCDYHACTEIRASALSGECNWLHEIYRGHTTLELGHKECVKRRAILSVSMNSPCALIAKESVEKVFDKCYNDTSPFPK